MSVHERRTPSQLAADLRYISNPMLWVLMTCPVKRHVTDATGYSRLETAYLTGDGPNLYFGNIYMMSADDKKEAFADFRAIIDAGWEVD